VRHASTGLAARATLLIFGLTLATAAVAQSPWRGWVGPWADGIFGLRFGMDRAACRRQVQEELDLRARSARPGTLRYEGRLAGAPASLVLEFTDGPHGGGELLHRILIAWEGIGGGGSRAQKLFELLEKGLRERYGSPLLIRDASIADISSGYKEAVRLHEGPEAQAQLTLRSPGTGNLRVQLILISPQLHPDFPR
jgi:hypothetical protein